MSPPPKNKTPPKLIGHPQTYAFAQMKDEIVLRHKEDAKSCIRAKFFEDDRGVFVLSIQGYTVATMKPHNASFSFAGDEIGRLVEFLNQIQLMPLKNRGSIKITDEELRRVVLSNLQVKALLRDNQELFAEVLRAALTKEDVVAVGYRKGQLKVFARLLEDEEYFESIRARKGCGAEALWQKFFEKNPWIFGYGLSYVYLSRLDDKKLEQVVHGHAVFERGKRVDALLRSRGVISSLCFVEIKTHRTELLREESFYRSGCWAPSAELAGALLDLGAVADADHRDLAEIAPPKALVERKAHVGERDDVAVGLAVAQRRALDEEEVTDIVRGAVAADQRRASEWDIGQQERVEGERAPFVFLAKHTERA